MQSLNQGENTFNFEIGTYILQGERKKLKKHYVKVSLTLTLNAVRLSEELFGISLTTTSQELIGLLLSFVLFIL